MKGMAASLRKMFRFRLRTLLLLVTIASIWLGLYVRSFEKQRKVVAAIQKYGGWVHYDFQYPTGDYSPWAFDSKARSPVPTILLEKLGVDFFHNIVDVNLSYSEDSGQREENSNRSDAALQILPALPKLRLLALQESQVSDESMRYLAELKNLEYLYMWDVHSVTDAGVAHLKDLSHLHYVHLSSSQITDRSLEVLGQLPKIEGLALQFNNFTDEGLVHLQHCTQLTDLWLCGKEHTQNGITDAGLKRLEGLVNLTRLGMSNTQVTSEGLQAFSTAVPACKVFSVGHR